MVVASVLTMCKAQYIAVELPSMERKRDAASFVVFFIAPVDP